MRYCARCKQWVNTMNPGGFPAHLCQKPEDGHTFRIEAVSRSSYRVGNGPHTDADWFAEEPFTIEVRAWNLKDALKLAAEQPLYAWRLGERRLDIEEPE